jgi:hypothetical protein
MRGGSKRNHRGGSLFGEGILNMSRGAAYSLGNVASIFKTEELEVDPSPTVQPINTIDVNKFGGLNTVNMNKAYNDSIEQANTLY